LAISKFIIVDVQSTYPEVNYLYEKHMFKVLLFCTKYFISSSLK